MNSNLETIKGLVLLLDEDELTDLNKTINSLLNKNKDSCFENEDTELFYKIINKSFITPYAPLSVLSKNSPKLYKRVFEVSEFLNQYLEKIIIMHNKKTGELITINKKYKIILFSFYADIMAKWFEEIGVPYSLKSILNNHNKFPALINRQFPSYIKSGLFVPFVFHNSRTSQNVSTHNKRLTLKQ